MELLAENERKVYASLEAAELGEFLTRSPRLERFSLRRRYWVAAMSDEVPAFRWRKQLQRDPDELDDVVERARPCRTQEGFQLREREFDRIEIGAVGRQELEPRAPLFHGRADRRLFVRRQVVEHDHVTGLERGREDLLHIGEERRIVDRTIKHGRGIELAEA